MSVRIQQTKKELEKQLSDQLELLKQLASLYDQGQKVVAKAMATSVRVLLHDTKKSKSLLGQLNLKVNRNFFDSCTPFEDLKEEGVQRVGSYSGLVNIGVGKSGGYLPSLDDPARDCFGFVSFDGYWNRVILIDQKKNEYTRSYIIDKVANQDGGAHVDPSLDEKYIDLARKNSMGWKTSSDDKNWTDLGGIELAVVRQMAHEVIRTFDPEYPKQKAISGNGFILGGMGIWISDKKKDFKNKIQLTKKKKIGVNEKCPCGSDKKWKKCHGKNN